MIADSAKPGIATVLLPLALADPFSYRVPDGMAVEAGSYVAVPLGPRQVIGVVWSMGDDAPDGVTLRKIYKLYDIPAMPALHREVIDWLAAYYLQVPGNVLRMALRATGVFGDRKEILAYRATGQLPERMTPQRTRVLAIAEEGPAFRAAELAEMAGTGAQVVRGLVAAGALEAVPLPAHAPFEAPIAGGATVQLSKSQAEAARKLRQTVNERGFSVTLIDGVTGAGKTEVYFEAMATALAAGRQVLLLLPEIALTGPFLKRIEQRFGVPAAEWHSDVRARERERVWLGVATGEARIVVGARSALFLPWARLGLIVVDEEHEPAFKQSDGVNYHGRDMAVVYGALGKFAVILSSATPSLESLVNVDRGRYRVIRLANRHGKAELPELSLIDLRAEPPERGSWLCEQLCHAVTETLNSGSQALLFLNRRGYAPLTLCRACGERLECPNCSSWLVEHRFRRQLMCHHCGHAEPVPETCPSCGSKETLVPCGPGVERLAEEAATRWPEARIAVLSSDLQRGQPLRRLIAEIADGNHDLIIGTQMIAKGHHFPGLTLAGIVDADLALETIDPRAGERTWQLLAQVAGRAGRGGRPGRALVQTYMPDHPLMQALASDGRDAFLAHEKAVREAAGLPPYGLLAGIVISGAESAEAERFARMLASRIPQGHGVHVLGPAPAPMAVVRGRHRLRFLVKARRDIDIQAYLTKWLGGITPKGSLRLDVDVDPYSFL